ncbi:MAG: hypothetical protein ACRDJW_05275 [Thermomicrobiales bacterium]
MDVRETLHQMIDGLDDTQAAVVHDYLIWFLSREQEPELTPEEQAAVDHDLAIIRRWQAEDHCDEGDGGTGQGNRISIEAAAGALRRR